MEGQQRKAKNRPPSAAFKRPVWIAGRRTTVSLEAAFWEALKEIATSKGISLYDFVSQIDRKRDLAHQNANLSSAIRVSVLTHYRILAKAKR